MIRCIVVAYTLLLVSSVFAQSHPAPAETDIREALAKFIRAFDDLGWERFRLAFDDNATVFYPHAVPQRANGRAEFEKAFKTVFRQIRDGKTAAPCMDIQPRVLDRSWRNIAIIGQCLLILKYLNFGRLDDASSLSHFLPRRTSFN